MRNIAVYDNGGKTFDRITIVFLNTKRRPLFGGKFYDYDCIGSSENGLGFLQWGSCQRGRHLGRRIPYESLSLPLRSLIIDKLNQAS
jgi:hypothetical protein